jgi:tricorn protease
MTTYHRRCWGGILLFLLLAGAGPAARADETRLLRFPAIHGEQIAFTYAGDLYTVPAAGGVARRLTSHEGFEMFPRFSPDGKWIGFTGQYDGNTEVYLMPAEGGVPQRLTFTATLGRDDVSDRMGPNNIVMTWKEDRIVFRSRRTEWNDFNGQLYYANREGGLPEQLPLPRGGWCSFSPDGKKLAYNRVFREFRTWKRYRGGQADEIWIHDFATRKTENLTQNPAQDIFPMWRGAKIYFISDRDENKRFNLFVIDPATSETRQLTQFKDFDIKFPSLGDREIVFENGGYIYRFNPDTEALQKVSIVIHEDFALGRGGLKDVSREINDYDVSPDGNRGLFGARGELFTVPQKYGSTRNLTQTSGVHERNGTWSPDGQWIACISDASGEDEIHLIAQDGARKPRQLTTGGDTYKYDLLWSPDSRKILWSDKKQRLQFVEVKTKAVTLVVQATAWEIRDYDWSPDSQWITYTKPEERQMPRIYLYSVAKAETYPVTDSWFASSDPKFSADGKYLFFVSNRSFSPAYSQTEWNHAYFDMAGLFFVTLAKETPSPFAPRSDEVKIDAPPKKEPAKEGADKKPAEGKGAEAKPGAEKTREEPKLAKTKVEPEGLGQRIGMLPIPAANYGGIASAGDKVYYLRRSQKDPRSRLFVYDLDKQKETELGEVGSYRLASRGKKMIVNAEGGYAIIDLPTARIDLKEKLNLSEVKITLDRRAEWNQIYRECWRQMRDFLYAPNLHGVDWPKIRANYEPLLAHVQHRADLTYIIGEMISELNIGHAYVGGGDYPKPARITQGLLGAQLERDATNGFYRIRKILKGQNWDRSLRSPLTEMGVQVRAGEYIVAVNGKPANKMKDIYAALVDTVDKQVKLRVNATPEAKGSREIVVVPIGDERPLYYLNWVQHNLDHVAEATGGKVGYVHIPNMGVEGLNEFVKFFYPQLNKEGLVVDVRGNGGGNVSPMIIERLRREISMITVARNGSINVDPSGMVLGPKVMLLDEFSASDGDIVAYRFKKHQLGPVIGKRSWGGVVGIRGSLPLLDGGYLNRPEFSRYDVEGKEWIMEGKGVEPDIWVDNDPAHELDGIDDQLEKAIEVIQDALKKNPVKLPPPPPWPDKSH